MSGRSSRRCKYRDYKEGKDDSLSRLSARTPEKLFSKLVERGEASLPELVRECLESMEVNISSGAKLDLAEEVNDVVADEVNNGSVEDEGSDVLERMRNNLI